MPIAAPPAAPVRGSGDAIEALSPGALSPKQREMLQTGLRFVRSSLTMNVQEPTDSVVADRAAELDQLAELERHFGMKPR